MYKAIIKTKYNTITMEIEDVNNPQFQEVCEQPYIEEVRIEPIYTKEELIEQQKECLYHVTGTSYWNDKALKLKRKIEEGK